MRYFIRLERLQRSDWGEARHCGLELCNGRYYGADSGRIGHRSHGREVAEEGGRRRQKQDEPLVELETDKVTLEVSAPAAGVLSEIVAKKATRSSSARFWAACPTAARPPQRPPRSLPLRRLRLPSLPQPLQRPPQRPPSQSPAVQRVAAETNVNAG